MAENGFAWSSCIRANNPVDTVKDGIETSGTVIVDWDWNEDSEWCFIAPNDNQGKVAESV